ncbi:MAG TPA: MOP flippase family protein [Candidatus Acidoferrales bacterium]|nr:MOP flippase family protein [Candidatus Acidoferrales bacterium]
MQDLNGKIRTGVAWTGLTQVAGQTAYLVISVILTRLLSPQDFGLVAMVLVFTGFASVFTDLGFGASLVQKLDLNQHHKNAVFWISIVAGALVTLIMAAAAPYIASFYSVPALQPLTVAISLIFFINAFATVKAALLQKAMDFRKLAAAQLTGIVLSGIVAIYIAFSGFGVWSIVAMYVVNAIVYAATLWIITPWRPNFSLQWKALKDLSKFSRNMLGFSAFNYWTRNGDNLLIGRYAGSAALGIYSRSYTILLLPVAQVSGVIANVMFPALSAIQKDVERVKDVYLKSISVISLVTFPLTLGLLVVSQSFVLALFGDKWAGMIPILQVFCLLGALQSIGTTVGWIYQSQGRTDIMFRLGLISGSIFIISFVVGLRWGAIGVAVAYTLANLLVWYPTWAIPARLIGLDFLTMLRCLAPTFYGAAVMAFCVWVLGLLLPRAWPSPVCLALQVAFGAIVYWIFVYALRLEAYSIASRLFAAYLGQVRTR